MEWDANPDEDGRSSCGYASRKSRRDGWLLQRRLWRGSLGPALAAIFSCRRRRRAPRRHVAVDLNAGGSQARISKTEHGETWVDSIHR
jgi:hypothetical protein